MNELKRVIPTSQSGLELRKRLSGKHKVDYTFNKGDPHESIISALRLLCDMKKED